MIGEGMGRTVQNRGRLVQSHCGDHILQAPVALFHLLGTAPTVGCHQSNVIELGAEQCLCHGKRVVSLVEKVSIRDDAHLFYARNGKVAVGSHSGVSFLYIVIEQHRITLSAEAVLKPSGGNCAVLP